MGTEPLAVALVWHQHQPLYRDLITGEHRLPWVRLHGVKDYLDMALILEEFPAMRMTINLVPSLVEQIEEFARGEANDPWLRLAERPADALSDEEKRLILDRFFSAPFDTMIAPHERYRELHARHVAGERLDVEDWRDLQVWFHLAWTDPLHIERDADLQRLVAKGRGFTEDNKRLLLAKHRAILAAIVPAHCRLQRSGQLEVTTTPRYHPILPLLCDSAWGRAARPDITLPTERFRHPEDAEAQVREGLDFMAARLGAPPRGMWPSEGSVCEEIVPILARAGVRWIASDEEVLAKSLGVPLFTRDERGRVNDMDALCRPYTVEVEGHRLAMIFRDHVLSDFIGFEAARREPADAAETLLARLRDVAVHLRDAEGPHLVSLILDGENCWEYHRDDGLPFLRALCAGLCEDESLRPVRVSDFLDAHPPTRTLPRLHAGSWINHDFAIWIGHAEKNRAWEYLAHTRDRVTRHIEEHRATLSDDQIALAWRAIFAAEGSDWNWWYGDDHDSGMDEVFDDLFRRHLAAAHRAVGLEPSAMIQTPILVSRDGGAHTPPCGMVAITPDGRETHADEWSAAGRHDPLHGGGAMHQAEQIIAALRYGFGEDHLALRVDLTPTAQEDGVSAIDLLTLEPTPQRFRVTRGEATAERRDFEGKTTAPAAAAVTAAWDEFLEMVIPLAALGAERGDRLAFQVIALRDGLEIDRAPARAPLVAAIPDAAREAAP